MKINKHIAYRTYLLINIEMEIEKEYKKRRDWKRINKMVIKIPHKYEK